jgi:hypothetical protein
MQGIILRDLTPNQMAIPEATDQLVVACILNAKNSRTRDF